MRTTAEDRTVALRIEALEQTVENLRRTVRRSRIIAIGLAAVVAPLILVGANQVGQAPKAPTVVDEIVAKRLSIVDADGKVRIAAWTDKDGGTFMGCRDANGTPRIGMGTDKDGAAAVAWFDADGKNRIKAAADKHGAASVDWFDVDGNLRIMAGTDKFGRVVLPTEDLKRP